MRNKPEGVYKLGQLIVTNFTEKNVGNYSCSLKYETGYNLSALGESWSTLRDKEYVITTYTTELQGDAGDASINTVITSKPEGKDVIAAAALWNKLPIALKQSKTTQNFKKNLKNWLTKDYISSREIINADITSKAVFTLT